MAFLDISQGDSIEVTGSEEGDDGSVSDITTCLTDEVTNVSCFEIKWDSMTPSWKGIRIEIPIDPADVDTGETMQIRVILESTMAAGKITIAPYTDSNSISNTNAILGPEMAGAGTYDHDLTAALIGDLGDLGGKFALRLYSTEAEATKPKVAEIDYDITESSGDATGEPTGAEISGDAGAPASVTTDQILDATGAEISGDAGTVTFEESRDQVSQFGAFGSHGLPIPSYGAFTHGGGTSATGEPSGAAIAGEAGTVTVTGDVNVTLTGAEISGDAGTVTPNVDVNVSITGAESAGEAQAPASVTTDQILDATGAEISGDAGTVIPNVDVNISITGAESAGEAGTVTAEADVNVSLTGAEISGDAGTVTAVIPDVVVPITGAASAGEAGTVIPNVDVNVSITGAAVAGEAGTIAAKSAFGKLSPTGLVARPYGSFEKQVLLSGAQAAAAAGVVSVVVTTTAIQLGPHGLTSKPRKFGISGVSDVNAFVTGAQIQGQAADPDSSHATIYTDGEEIEAQAGTVIADAIKDEVAFVTGAEAAAEAGTVVSAVNVSPILTGAEIVGQAGETTPIPTGGAIATPLGAGMVAEAGAVTVTAIQSPFVAITGAKIDAQAAEVGLDTNFDVSVLVYSGTILGEAGTVVFGDDVVSEEEEVEEPSGGWAALNRYQGYKQVSRRKKRRRKKLLEEVQKIEAKVDREIAELLHARMAKEARVQELLELEALITETISERELLLAKMYNERVAVAYARAAVQGNFSALEAFEREMDRAEEEEFFLLIAMLE